jgi:hypothetical protein
MKAIQQWFSKGSPIGLLILGVVVGRPIPWLYLPRHIYFLSA